MCISYDFIRCSFAAVSITNFIQLYSVHLIVTFFKVIYIYIFLVVCKFKKVFALLVHISTESPLLTYALELLLFPPFLLKGKRNLILVLYFYRVTFIDLPFGTFTIPSFSPQGKEEPLILVL